MELEIRMLSVKEVMEMTGLSRTTLWRRVRNGEFPLPRQLGPRRSAWLNTEILDHLTNLPAVSHGGKDCKNFNIREARNN
jgi:prophage regulatory protein